MFRETNSPILRSISDCIYSFWYNAPKLLPTGTKVEMDFNRGTCQQQCPRVVLKAVHSQKVFLRMGEFVARNM